MNAFVGADLYEDGFPHGTVDGYRKGCKGSACPESVLSGLSCRKAFTLSAGDRRYSRMVAEGATPAQIASTLLAGAEPSKPDPEEGKKMTTPTPAEVARHVPAPSSSKTSKTADPLRLSDLTEGLSQRQATELGREIRAWARENGFPDIASHGTMPSEALRAWLDYHAEQEPDAEVDPDDGSKPLPGLRAWVRHDDGVGIVMAVNGERVLVGMLPDPRDDETTDNDIFRSARWFPATEFAYDTFPDQSIVGSLYRWLRDVPLPVDEKPIEEWVESGNLAQPIPDPIVLVEVDPGTWPIRPYVDGPVVYEGPRTDLVDHPMPEPTPAEDELRAARAEARKAQNALELALEAWGTANEQRTALLGVIQELELRNSALHLELALAKEESVSAMHTANKWARKCAESDGKALRLTEELRVARLPFWRRWFR